MNVYRREIDLGTNPVRWGSRMIKMFQKFENHKTGVKNRCNFLENRFFHVFEVITPVFYTGFMPMVEIDSLHHS